MRGQRDTKPQRRGQEPGSTDFKPVQSVDSKAALASANTRFPTFLNLASQWSIWTFDGANHAADVTGDPTQVTYVAIASDTTGASGAWIKRIT